MLKKLSIKIYSKFKNDIVLTVSFLLALISCLFIKSTIYEYVHTYINYSVIILLFCFMTSIAGLSKYGTLRKISHSILKRTPNTRIAATTIVITTFFASMFITNDVALITFIPICLILFKESHNQSQLIKIITFQTIAANIGSILTPFGNPQNLFIYTSYNIGFIEFLKISFIPTTIGIILLIISMFLIYPKEISQNNINVAVYSKKKTIFYGFLFLISLIPIFHIWHYLISLFIILSAVLIYDRKILRKIDYGLLLTFICFFIFIGNMQKVPGLHMCIKNFLNNKLFVYISSVTLSQFISNVPAAILLSSFTQDYKSLILGVNVGGLGTLIASLANIISYNYFKNFRKNQKNKYLKYFLLINVIYLIIVFIFVYIISIK